MIVPEVTILKLRFSYNPPRLLSDDPASSNGLASFRLVAILTAAIINYSR